MASHTVDLFWWCKVIYEIKKKWARNVTKSSSELSSLVNSIIITHPLPYWKGDDASGNLQEAEWNILNIKRAPVWRGIKSLLVFPGKTFLVVSNMKENGKQNKYFVSLVDISSSYQGLIFHWIETLNYFRKVKFSSTRMQDYLVHFQDLCCSFF